MGGRLINVLVTKFLTLYEHTGKADLGFPYSQVFGPTLTTFGGFPAVICFVLIDKCWHANTLKWIGEDCKYTS